MKPISTPWPSYDWLWKMKLVHVINAPERSASPSQCPLPQTANMMI